MLIVAKRTPTPDEYRRWLATTPGFIQAATRVDERRTRLAPHQVRHLRNESKFRACEKARGVGFSFICAAEALARAQLSRGDYTAIFVSINLEEADCPANANGETPLVWTGRMLSWAEAVRRFAFTRKCRLRHVDGLTYEFLFAMAKELDEADSLVLVGAGAGGSDPIILERNGLPYRGFLEGRVRGDRYLFVLHLTSLELVVPVEASE